MYGYANGNDLISFHINQSIINKPRTTIRMREKGIYNVYTIHRQHGAQATICTTIHKLNGVTKEFLRRQERSLN